MPTPKSEEGLQQSLQQVKALLERHRVLESLAHRQEGPKRDLLESLVHRQNLAEFHNRLKALHPADLASILESLPGDDRTLVWNQLEAPQAGDVLLEVPPPSATSSSAPPTGSACSPSSPYWTRTTSPTWRRPCLPWCSSRYMACWMSRTALGSSR